MPVQYLNEEGEQKTRYEWEITWTTTERKAVSPSVFTDELKSARQAGCVEGYAKFENLMPCKLRWKFYKPNNPNPAVVLSTALLEEFSDEDVIENILLVANSTTHQEGEQQDGPVADEAGHDREPDFEAFTDDIDIPDEFEPDDMP